MFPETGPGKGSVGGVGATIKNVNVAYNPDTVIGNIEKLLNIYQSENITIGKYTDSAIYSLLPILKYSDVLSGLLLFVLFFF